nr:hypothetical protein [Tanacetum cinerariifolium]
MEQENIQDRSVLTMKLVVVLIPSLIVQPSLATLITYMLREPIKNQNRNNQNQNFYNQNRNQGNFHPQGNNQGRNQFFQGANQVERETEATKDMVHPTNNETIKDVQPPVVQTESPILNFEPVVAPIIKPFASPVNALKPIQRTSIPYPSRLYD